MKIVSQALRDSAKGETCTLRLDGCEFRDTVVLAHLPCGMKGMSMKSPDMISCYACQNCHDILDGRKGGVLPTPIEGWDVVRALAETQIRFVQKGLMIIKGVK